MPIFEYRCRKCGAQFEKIQANAAAEATCPTCHSAQVEKLLSAFAVGAARAHDAATESPCCTCSAREKGLCSG